MISPIYIRPMNFTGVNTLNSYEDHRWDGFYTSQLRLSRWPTLIQTGNDAHYTIDYTGTPPSKQRFRLISDNDGVVVRIKYTKPGVYVINDVNGNLIKAN